MVGSSHIDGPGIFSFEHLGLVFREGVIGKGFIIVGWGLWVVLDVFFEKDFIVLLQLVVLGVFLFGGVLAFIDNEAVVEGPGILSLLICWGCFLKCWTLPSGFAFDCSLGKQIFLSCWTCNILQKLFLEHFLAQLNLDLTELPTFADILVPEHFDLFLALVTRT